jgi:hypothetical protein
MSEPIHTCVKDPFANAEAFLQGSLRELSVLVRSMHRVARGNSEQRGDLHTHVVWGLWHYDFWWNSIRMELSPELSSPVLTLAVFGDIYGQPLVRIGPVTAHCHASALGQAAGRMFESIQWVLTTQKVVEQLSESGFQSPSDIFGGPFTPPPPKKRPARNAPWWHGTMRYAGSHYDAPLVPFDLHPAEARNYARRWEVFSAVAEKVDIEPLVQQTREDWQGADSLGWWEWLQATIAVEMAEVMRPTSAGKHDETPRLAFDEAILAITLDGKTYKDIDPIPFRLVCRLHSAGPGQSISGAKLKQMPGIYNKNLTREFDKLPRPVRGIVRSAGGKGYWLQLPSPKL